MQDFTETSASSISLGSLGSYYRELPDQFHLDLPGESSTSFTGTAIIESDDTNNNAASNTMSPLTGTIQPKPRFALSFREELEHSTLTPVTLATTFALSSSSSKDNYNELPMPSLNAFYASSPSCPPEQLQVQSAVTAPVPLEVEDTDSSQCRIKVAIRLRPLESQELVQPRRSRRGSALRETRAWSLVPEEATSKASSGRRGSGSTLFQKGAIRRIPGRTDFSFDAVFDENVQTSQVYQDIARPIVKGVASGRHGTIFSYGQTGMGKTFTMQGGGNSVDTGIIQMAAVDLFRMIESSSSQRQYVVKAQYFEIYNEQIRDLLPTTTTTCEKMNSLLELPILSAQEDPVTRNVHVNAHEVKVNGVDDVCRLLSQGNRNRACAATNLNAQSSRSHAIFRLLLESREELPDDQTMRVSVLNMVDLAGSENSKSAGVTGIRKREGGNINQSLLSLSRVIHALSLPIKKRPKHISFRDAKLTRILQPHLLGNACMAILCCVSASSLHFEETRSTLRFAASAKLIEMKPTVNEVVDHQSLLKKLQTELAETKTALQKLQSQNRSDIDDRECQSASAVPVSELLLSMSERESMRTDLLTESGSVGDGVGQIIEDSQWMPLQTPKLGDSESKTAEVPPISEVCFSVVGSAHNGDLTTRLVQTDKRSKYLEEKLEATNDLVRTLVCELEKSRRNNVDCNQGSQALKYRVGAMQEQDGMSNDGEFSVMRRQYLQMKHAIYLGLLFYTLGQSEKEDSARPLSVHHLSVHDNILLEMNRTCFTSARTARTGIACGLLQLGQSLSLSLKEHPVCVRTEEDPIIIIS